MPFDWNSGQKKSTGFDWDSGKPDEIVLPTLPKPKVEMKDDPTPLLAKPLVAAARYFNGEQTPTSTDATAHDYAYAQRAKKATEAEQKAGLAPMVPAGGYAVERDERPFEQVALAESKGDTTGAKIAKGAGRSAIKAARSLKEPENLAIMGGLAAVNAAQAIPGSQAVTVPLAQAANATAGTYFAAKMAEALPEQYREYQGALQRGDVGGATESLADMGITAAMSAGSARGAAEVSKPILSQRMGVAKPDLVAPPPLSNPEAQRGYAGWNDITETRGTLPNERPAEMPAEVPYAEAMRRREAARVAQTQRGSAPVDQAARKAELQARFRPTPPPEPTGVTAGKPAPLQPLGEPVFKSAKESADVFAQEGPKSAQESAATFRKELNQRPVVPESGMPENVLRVQDARERMAQQYAGKPWSELSNPERLQIDEWIQEGNRGAVNDRQNISGLSGQERVGQKPVQADALQGGGAEAAQTGRVLQTPGRSGLREVGTTGIRPTRRRSAGQGGALMLPDFLAKKGEAAQAGLDPESVQYIEQQKALREAAKKGAEPSFMDKLRSWRDAYRRTLNDTTVPLTDAMQKLDKQAGPNEAPASVHMNDLIDKKLGASKAASRWLQEEGILDAVGKVESLDALDQFMIAQRSAELEAAGFKSGRDLAADQAFIARNRDRIAIPASKDSPAMTYGQVAKRFTDANNKLLRMAVDSGIVNKDVADALVQKYGNYIPIDRIQEATDFAQKHGRGASQVASLARQTILQKLTGSERVIDNSIVSSIHRADRVFSQVARNDAAGFLRDGLTRLDDGKGTLIRPKANGENIPPERLISVFENGVKKDYVVPEDIGVAAKSLDVKQLGWAMQNLMQPATRLLKIGTTGLSLPFTVVNVFRDIGHTAVTQKGWAAIGGALDPRIYARGIKEVFDPKSKTMAALERHGGGFTSFDLSRGQVMPEIELMRAKRGSKEALSYVAHHPIRTVGALVRATENFLGKSEQFGRVRIYESEYRSAIKRGFSAKDAEILAAQEANNALPNYARAGSIGRVLNAMVPYLNARIQGVRSLTRAIERDPVGTIGKISAIGTAVAAVTAYNMMDDERREIYNDMQPYERRSNFIIILPGAKKNAKGRWEGILKIPIPQGIDSITDVARKQVEALYGSDPVKFNDLAESLVGAFTPVEPSPVSNNIGVNVAAGAANSMLPQTVKPTVQSLANFNFFRGQAIVPPHMAELPAGEQASPYTSSAAKTIARDVLPKVGLQTSPIKVEAWINDTLGGGGPMALRALDAAAEKTGLAEKQQERGGADPFSATEQRMTTVRGGAIDRKYYDLRKQLQDTIAQREIDILRQSADLDNMDRDMQRQLVNQALGRAKSQVQKLINDSHLDEVEGSAKVDMMKDLLASYQ